MGFCNTNLNINEHRELLSNVGYSGVKVTEEYDKDWICTLGKNPS